MPNRAQLYTQEESLLFNTAGTTFSTDAGETTNGNWFNIKGYTITLAGARSTQTGRILIEYSNDAGTTVITTNTQASAAHPISGNQEAFVSVVTQCNYVRVSWTNTAGVASDTHLYAVATNTGLITNYALESGGNLDAIVASLDIIDDWDQNDRCKTSPIVGQDGVSGNEGASNATTLRVWANLIAGQSGITGGAGVVAANTPRVTLANDDPAVVSLAIIDDWDATHDGGHASDGPQIMGDYNAVPDTVDTGDAVRIQCTSEGRLESASYDRATGADKVIEQSPALLDTQQGTARASAALPAAGAYDAATEIPVADHKYLEIWINYTRGAAGGSTRIRLEKAITIAGADNWGRDAYINPGVFGAGADVNSSIQREDWLYTATGATAEVCIMTFDISRCDKIRLPAAEVGAIANPGTLEIEYKLSN